MISFTDSHCHLDFAEFDDNREALLKQCAQADINRIIIPSITPNNWQQVLTLAANNQHATQLFACLGIHPWFLTDLPEQSLEDLSTLIATQRTNIIAVGEAGIDGAIVKQQDNLLKQQLFFDYQLQLAKQHQLPIIVHHRQSHQWLVPALKSAQLNKGGVIHAFSGSYQQAKAYLDLGFKLGIGGTITYPRAQKTIKTVTKLPVECLLLETDAPAMPLSNYQGQINSPLRITDVFKALCEIRSEPKEQLAEQLETNINDLFFKLN